MTPGPSPARLTYRSLLSLVGGGRVGGSTPARCPSVLELNRLGGPALAGGAATEMVPLLDASFKHPVKTYFFTLWTLV